MKELLISQYISKITPEQIQAFGYENQIYLTDDETRFIEYKIKTEWQTLLYGNPTPIFKTLEQELGVEKTKQIKFLYNEYKEKYKYYL